jgi:hypothetical protein
MRPQTLFVEMCLSGDRMVELQVWPTTLIVDVALKVQRHFCPEFDNNDIKLVHGVLCLAMHHSVKQAGLIDGAVVQGMVCTSWKVKVKTEEGLATAGRCICSRPCNRALYGNNFTVNVDALNPAFQSGRKTKFDRVIRLLDPDEIPIGYMNAAITRTREWLWNCIRCNAVAFTAGRRCVPVDVIGDEIVKWEQSSFCYVLCPACVRHYASESSEDSDVHSD